MPSSRSFASDQDICSCKGCLKLLPIKTHMPCKGAYIYIYIYTYIHTYIHTYIQSNPIQSNPIQSNPIHSIPFHSIPFHSIPLHYITLHYIHTYTGLANYTYITCKNRLFQPLSSETSEGPSPSPCFWRVRTAYASRKTTWGQEPALKGQSAAISRPTQPGKVAERRPTRFIPSGNLT